MTPPRPDLTRSEVVMFQNQKRHWQGEYNGHTISLFNAPDDIKSKPWRVLIWRKSDTDPEPYGELIANFRHYTTLEEALTTAMRRIDYVR